MKTTYDFTKSGWSKDDFTYTCSPRWKDHKEFIQKDGYITNDYGDGKLYYISLLTNKKYKKGTKIYARCSFKSFGAPLIVLSDDVAPNEEGEMYYGLHFEAVAWFKGLNVWRVIPSPERPLLQVHSTLLNASEFTIEDESMVEIEVTVEEKTLLIDINGHKLTVENDEIPESFRVGITACEGLNRFYELTIEE